MKPDRKLYYREYHQGMLDKFLKMTVYQKDKIRNITGLVSPQPGDVILEIGCSAGMSAAVFAQRGARVTGVDFDHNAVTLAKELMQQRPDLAERCRFLVARGEDMVKEVAPNKITMLDLTEHVPDDELKKIFKGLLQNPNPQWELFVYTPNREHWIEHMKIRNIILKAEPTHTDLRNMEETIKLLTDSGYRIKKRYYRPFHLPPVHQIEYPLLHLPWIGRLFRRRICLVAEPADKG